jgi:ferritin
MTATDTKAGETGFADVTFDLVSVQYHALKAGHDYEQFVQDAKDAGRDDIAEFIEQVAAEDANRAKKCHEFLKDLSGSPEAGEAVT